MVFGIISICDVQGLCFSMESEVDFDRHSLFPKSIHLRQATRTSSHESLTSRSDRYSCPSRGTRSFGRLDTLLLKNLISISPQFMKSMRAGTYLAGMLLGILSGTWVAKSRLVSTDEIALSRITSVGGLVENNRGWEGIGGEEKGITYGVLGVFGSHGDRVGITVLWATTQVSKSRLVEEVGGETDYSWSDMFDDLWL